jgi:hypothetical protein
MPKPTQKANLLHQQILAGLIETTPVSLTHKVLERDADGKEVVVQTKRTRLGLRFPLAQNVSGFNVDRAAQRWIAA